MKLMTVTCHFEYVIVVEDDAEFVDAIDVATETVREAFSDISIFDLDLYVVPYDHYKPNDWDDLCIPYGGDGNTRTSEYKETGKQA